MVYDISVLYGIPFDLDDPADTWKLVKLAFGIKAGEAAGGALTKGLPAFIRPAVKRIFSGPTLKTMTSLPVVGRYLLQRNIVKFTIPGVTIPVTTAVNRWTTKAVGSHAKDLLRREARIIEAAKGLVDGAADAGALLTVTWWAINLSAPINDVELLLLHHLTERASLKSGNQAFLERFRRKIEVDENDLWDAVSQTPRDHAQQLFRAAVMACVVDGKANKRELEFLAALAGRLGIRNPEQVIAEMQRRWR